MITAFKFWNEPNNLSHWYRPNAVAWFDRQMEALADFDTTITLWFTPPSRGKWQHHTSPPVDNAQFAYFAEQVVSRYVHNEHYIATPHCIRLEHGADSRSSVCWQRRQR